MKTARILVTSIILVIAFGAALYTQRVHISDLMHEANQQPLPAPVSYEEAANDAADHDLTSPEPIEPTDMPEPSPTASPEPTPSEPDPKPVEPAPTVTPEAPPDEPAPTVPTEYNLAVPFTSQAPTGNWDEVHEETCEEASLYMVHLYYQGQPAGQVDPDTAEAELQRIVNFELDLFGYYKDTTAAETATLAERLYGYTHVDVLENPTAEDIKAAIAAGHPVIVPAAGRELGNPYFTPPGPIYHMFVIRGYTADRFITNDPGTRHGEQFTYDIDTVMNAIHDWNADNIDNGAKRVIVVYPN